MRYVLIEQDGNKNSLVCITNTSEQAFKSLGECEDQEGKIGGRSKFVVVTEENWAKGYMRKVKGYQKT